MRSARLKLDHTSLVSCLCSTVIHSWLLVTLGLIAASVRDDSPLVLQLMTANTSAAPALETFDVVRVDLSLLETRPTEDVDSTAAQLEVLVAEPMLASRRDAADGRSAEDVIGSRQFGQQSNSTGTFFGTHAYGNQFVYVVDMSISMGYPSQYGDTRFEIACRELMRSINQLKPTQNFCVFMFCYQTRTMFDQRPQMLPATSANKQRLADWINGLGLGPGTDPRYGTLMAQRLDPDAIFLLSDGEFNGRSTNAHRIRGNVPIEQLIDTERTTVIPIHTVAFEDLLNRKRLRRISMSTRGTHRFVGRVSGEELLMDDLQSANQDDLMHGLQGLVDGDQKIHDHRTLRLATRLITNKLTSGEPEVRERAHQALRVLAGGEDMRTDSDQPQTKYSAAAAKKWKRYWAKRFREHSASQRRPDNRVE